MTDVSDDYERCIRLICEARLKIAEAEIRLPRCCGQHTRVNTALTLLTNAQSDLFAQYGKMKMEELMK